jgi:hypothetical protein
LLTILITVIIQLFLIYNNQSIIINFYIPILNLRKILIICKIDTVGQPNIGKTKKLKGNIAIIKKNKLNFIIQNKLTLIIFKNRN